ncbi:MAG: sulfatase [bacterium]|nr:sulfatase [bacterium]
MNVLMIIPDALKADNLHCYGYPKETSPFLDKLASEGVLFKNTISTSSHTLPGIASILTGLTPFTHGLDGPPTWERWRELWKPWKTPFNILGEKGYKIAGYDAWFYGRLGYDKEIKDLNKAIEEHKNKKFFLWYVPYQTHLPYNPKIPYDTMFMPSDYQISESTKQKLKVVKSTMIIHKPGLLSRHEREQSVSGKDKATHGRSAGVLTLSEEDIPAIIALYDGEIRSQDEEIEGYVKKLEDLNLLDDTIVVITSDHGEEIGERGSVGHASCSLAGTLHEEVVRVPLIIRYPKALPKGKVVETQVSLIDVMPTLFDIMGFEMPKETEGHSLMPFIKGEHVDFKEEAYLETRPCGWQILKSDERKVYAIRTPEWKFIYNRDPNNKDKCSYELYNLKDDPGEKHNLVSEAKDTTDQFKKKLHNLMDKPSFLLNK